MGDEIMVTYGFVHGDGTGVNPFDDRAQPYNVTKTEAVPLSYDPQNAVQHWHVTYYVA